MAMDQRKPDDQGSFWILSSPLPGTAPQSVYEPSTRFWMAVTSMDSVKTCAASSTTNGWVGRYWSRRCVSV